RIEKQLRLLQQSLEQGKKQENVGTPGSGIEPEFRRTKAPVKISFGREKGGGGPQPLGPPTFSEYLLYVSIDDAQTWNLVAKAKGDRDAFDYLPSDDGDYLFRVVGVDKQGRRVAVATGPRVIVDSVLPEIVLTAQREGQEVAVGWKITENYLDFESLR